MWTICVIIVKMSQVVPKAAVSQAHPPHAETTPLCTPCSSPCTSISSQQGNRGSQSTPEPSPSSEHLASKQNARGVHSSICMDTTTHSQPARITLPCLASTGLKPELEVCALTMGKQSALTLTAQAIYFALCWPERY